jgi:hypothetical protein
MQVISSSDASSITTPILLYVFGDVHALLTSAAKLNCFCQLPYSAIKAWASSDDLVVDSENSVAVAVNAWVEAPTNRSEQECSKAQKEELSGLLRVKHLSPGRLGYKSCLAMTPHNQPIGKKGLLKSMIWHLTLGCMIMLLFTGFLLYQLPRFPWFADTKGKLASFSVATLTGTDPCVDELHS